MKLTNTLTGKKEEFTPITEGKVGMYHCGPTVYDYVHIGNLRAFVLADLLRRTFEFNDYTVNQVVNITDIGHLSGDGDDGDDKMTKGLKREGKPLTLEAMKELADFYTERFKENLISLNIKLPHHMPKASEHIEEDITFIKTLEQKGFAYVTSDGVYFDTLKDPHYGKLGGISKDDSHARVESNSEKKNFRDFALWKFNSQLGFESPWGKGFPGWHIECSVMSEKYVGPHFDIHTGGIDLAPIHHNNEIAQSECAHEDHHFVNTWLHNAFVNIEGGKMAKSQGNFIRLQTLIDEGINPLAYRYWLLTAHYRTPINFSSESVKAAQTAYNKLVDFVSTIDASEKPDDNYVAIFKGFVNDDLDTPKAVALMWEVIKDEELTPEIKKATLLRFDDVLGLGLTDAKKVSIEIPEAVQKLVEEREQARKNKDFAKSDELRKQVEDLGFDIKDTSEGQKIFPKK